MNLISRLLTWRKQAHADFEREYLGIGYVYDDTNEREMEDWFVYLALGASHPMYDYQKGINCGI